MSGSNPFVLPAAPFSPLCIQLTISPISKVDNVAIRIQLSHSYSGLGEVGILHPVTFETTESALLDCRRVALSLPGTPLTFDPSNPLGLIRSFEARLKDELPSSSSCRAGFEMAAIDALARASNVPLYTFFGGNVNAASSTQIETDITIPLGSAREAEDLAGEYRRQGFRSIKVKVGRDVERDLERLAAIRRGHPKCELTCDGNEGFTAEEAIHLLQEAARRGILMRIFEQPCRRGDEEGMRNVRGVANALGTMICADESVRTEAEVRAIGESKSADMVNIKASSTTDELLCERDRYGMVFFNCIVLTTL